MWGDFAGVDDNMPVAKFPNLQALENLPYTDDEAREVSYQFFCGISRNICAALKDNSMACSCKGKALTHY